MTFLMNYLISIYLFISLTHFAIYLYTSFQAIIIVYFYKFITLSLSTITAIQNFIHVLHNLYYVSMHVLAHPTTWDFIFIDWTLSQVRYTTYTNCILADGLGLLLLRFYQDFRSRIFLNRVQSVINTSLPWLQKTCIL